MHELGIIVHVMRTVEEVAAENNLTEIRSVTCEIGEVSGVVPEYMADCFAPFGRIYFNLSSLGTILLHPGSSLCNLIASNSHFVVQIPQPIHLFWSTTEAPHPRQRAVSALTCSSVNTSFASRKECFVSMESLCPGIWRLELS